MAVLALKHVFYLCLREDILEVEKVHVFSREYEINKKEHHTDKYYNFKLIVRRGQTFHIQITFNRAYNPEKDQFWIEYLIGKCQLVPVLVIFIVSLFILEKPRGYSGKTGSFIMQIMQMYILP